MNAYFQVAIIVVFVLGMGGALLWAAFAMANTMREDAVSFFDYVGAVFMYLLAFAVLVLMCFVLYVGIGKTLGFIPPDA